MYLKLVLFFFFIYSVTIPFSRNPDYFDGKMTEAVIQSKWDSTSKKNQLVAAFAIDEKDTIYYNPHYWGRTFSPGDTVKTIYSTSHPQDAAVYSFWGYWFVLNELLVLLGGYVILFLISLAITSSGGR